MSTNNVTNSQDDKSVTPKKSLSLPGGASRKGSIDWNNALTLNPTNGITLDMGEIYSDNGVTNAVNVPSK